MTKVLALVVGSLLLLGLAGGGLAAYSSGRALQRRVTADLVAAESELSQGRDLLKRSLTDRLPSTVGLAQQHLDLARQRFQAAGDEIDGSRLSLVGAVPVVGGPIATGRHLIAMGMALTAAGAAAGRIDLRLIAPSATTSGGQRLLDILQASSADIASARGSLDIAQSQARQVDPGLLPEAERTAFLKARASIDRADVAAEQLARVAPILEAVLGRRGQRTYLIEQVNPAELRPGGGFIGSYSLVTATAGKLQVIKSGSTQIDNPDFPRPRQGQPGYIPPPPPLAGVAGPAGGWFLGDSNFSPDFPVAAEAGEMFVASDLHITPDGVFSIDPEGIAGLLAVTGPIPVPGYGTTVRPQDFPDYVFQIGDSAGQIPMKKLFLAAVGAALVQRVSALPADRWPGLLAALSAAAAGRHLQVYFNDGAAESLVAGYGWSGTLNPHRVADFLNEDEANVGGSKANHFLTRRFRLDLSVAGKLLHHQLTIDLQNSEPPGYEGSRIYKGYIRLFVPAGASHPQMRGAPPGGYTQPPPPAGLQMTDALVTLDPTPTGSARAEVTFDWDTPAPSSYPDPIDWQKQAGTGPDPVQVTFRGASSARPVTAGGSLAGDLTIRLGTAGPTLVSAAPSPVATLGLTL